MAEWWEGLSGDEIAKRAVRNTEDLLNKNDDIQSDPSGLEDFDTTIDTSGVSDVTIDFSAGREAIKDAATKPIKQEDIDYQRSLRPDNEYEPILQDTLSSLRDYASGESPVDRTISNRLLDRFDATAATSQMRTASQVAANPYLSVGAREAAIAENQRNIGSQRAELVGELAQQAQERAYNSLSLLGDLSLRGMDFKESQYKTDLETIGDNLSRELDGAIKSGEMSVAEVSALLEKEAAILVAKTAEATNELTRISNLADYNIAMKQLGITEDELNFEIQKHADNLGLDYDKLNLDKVRVDILKDEVELRKAELVEDVTSMWTQTAANAILEAKMGSQDGTLSYQDVLNNPYLYQAVVNMYQANPQNAETKPSESWVMSFIDSIKTEQQSTIETRNARINDMRTYLVGTEDNPGPFTQEQFDTFVEDMLISGFTENTIKKNDDGTISFIGVDGEPLSYIDEDGNRVEVKTDGGDPDAEPDDEPVKTGFADYFNESNIENIKDRILSGDISDVRQLTFVVRDENEFGIDDADEISDETIKNFFDSTKIGITPEKMKEINAKLDSIYMEYPEDLLYKENSDILFDVWEESPDSIRNSDYYLTLTPDDIKDIGIHYTDKIKGHKTRFASDDDRIYLNSVIGRIVELDGSFKRNYSIVKNEQEPMVGQLVDIQENPSSITLIIKQTDGSMRTYTLAQQT